VSVYFAANAENAQRGSLALIYCCGQTEEALITQQP